MVVAHHDNKQDGDGIVRSFQYARFRTDKAPEPGYSAELISNNVPPEYFDNLEGQDMHAHAAETDTLLKLFKRNVS